MSASCLWDPGSAEGVLTHFAMVAPVLWRLLPRDLRVVRRARQCRFPRRGNLSFPPQRTGTYRYRWTPARNVPGCSHPDPQVEHPRLSFPASDRFALAPDTRGNMPTQLSTRRQPIAKPKHWDPPVLRDESEGASLPRFRVPKRSGLLGTWEWSWIPAAEGVGFAFGDDALQRSADPGVAWSQRPLRGRQIASPVFSASVAGIPL